MKFARTHYGHFFTHKKAPPKRGWYAHHFHHLHGAGCLPVSSVSAPEPAILPAKAEGYLRPC
ncbi:hypothetical protein C7B16_10610 [Escherichia sp. 20412-1]|nr:hypothetical protein C7B16_10610 [Escherichia sp. 20412-1]